MTPVGVDRTQLEGRGPIAPRFVFPVIDRAVYARRSRVVTLDAETETIQRLRIERPPGYHYRAGQHALLRLATEQGPDLRRELPGPVHAGRLSAELLRRQAEELPDAIFYVTGPAAMVGDVRSMLRGVGVAHQRIRSVAQGYR